MPGCIFGRANLGSKDGRRMDNHSHLRYLSCCQDNMHKKFADFLQTTEKRLLFFGTGILKL
jgi:hypothetical protein